MLDNSASLSNAGVAYVVLDDWGKRGKVHGEDLLSIYTHLNARAAVDVLEARTFVVMPPPIQGIGNAGGFTMQVEIRNGNFDYALLQSLADMIAGRQRAVGLQRLATSFRAGAPQFDVDVDRSKAETLGVTVGQVFPRSPAISARTTSTQFNKFGHVFQVYVQASRDYRAERRRHPNLKVQGRRRHDDAARHPGRGHRRARARR